MKKTRRTEDIDVFPTKRLCAAVIQHALKDAREPEGRHRVATIAWLASTRATFYLDPLNIPQSTFLTRCGWMDWAREVEETLFDLPYETNEATINTICRAFTYLKALQARQTYTPEDPRA